MRLRDTWAVGVLAAICAAGVLLVVLLGLQLSFFNDDWYILLQRPGLASKPGFDAYLQAHNGNIVILFVAVYRAMSWLFGLHSQLPYRVLLGLTVAALGVVVYLMVSSRLGRVIGLICAAVVVFLGPAWEALLFFAGFGDFASVALGLGALWVLERDTPRRNAVACLLLVASVMTFSIGVAFVFGAAIVIGLRHRARQWWIALLPALLFGAWWLGYGAGQPSHVSLANLEHLPRYVIDSCASGLAAIVGLHSNSAGSTLFAGHLALAVVLVAGFLVMIRGGRPRGWFFVYAGTALCFWLLSGANYYTGRAPTASRYVVFDAPLVIVTLAELLRGVRTGSSLRALALAAGIAVIALNLKTLEAGYDFMQMHARNTEAALGALQLAGGESSQQQLLAPVAHDPFLSGVTPARYFEVTESLGTPAHFSPQQLAGAPAAQRAAIDSVLASVGGITMRTTAARASRGCEWASVARSSTGLDEPVPPAGTMIVNRSMTPLVVMARRFGSGWQPVSFLAPRGALAVSVPRDHSPVPWQVALLDGGATNAEVGLCGPAGEVP